MRLLLEVRLSSLQRRQISTVLQDIGRDVRRCLRTPAIKARFLTEAGFYLRWPAQEFGYVDS